MSTTDQARDPREPRPAEGTSPADAIDTRSPKAAGRDALGIGNQLRKAFGEDGLTTQAAAVAYNFLFAIAPLLIFIMALASAVSRAVYDDTDEVVAEVIAWLTERLPENSAAALEPVITGAVDQAGAGIISVGALLALFGARGAMGALIGALNVSYHVEETRGFVRKQLLAIGLTFATGFGIIFAIALFLFGDYAGTLVAGWVGLGDAWAFGWNIARFPIILVILVTALAALYWAGPNTTIPFRWLSPGAIAAVIGWVLITLFINVYFRYAGGYAESYGLLGGVLAFVFYLYLMSLVILVGGEINAILARRVPQEDGAPATDDDASDAPVGKVDERFRDAVHDARGQLRDRLAAGSGTGPAPSGAPAVITPEGGRPRGSAAKGLVAGAGAAAAGALAVILGRR